MAKNEEKPSPANSDSMPPEILIRLPPDPTLFSNNSINIIDGP